MTVEKVGFYKGYVNDVVAGIQFGWLFFLIELIKPYREAENFKSNN